MGIRVRCPNGHPLNLKSHLAGRRGLCPDCGARFRIPTESSDVPQPFAEPPKRSVALQANHAAPKSGSVDEAGQIPLAMPVASVPPVRPTVDSQLADATQSNVAFPVEKALPAMTAVGPAMEPPFAATMTAATTDPLMEAPHAAWYVQPPTGGRYGPAKVDVIRQWIAEGRITEACLVWRDGWSEWQSASTILGSGSTSGVVSVGAVGAADFLPSGGSTVARRARNRGSKGLGVSMIIILGLACVGLFLLLFFLITNGTISLTPPGPAG